MDSNTSYRKHVSAYYEKFREFAAVGYEKLRKIKVSTIYWGIVLVCTILAIWLGPFAVERHMDHLDANEARRDFYLLVNDLLAETDATIVADPDGDIITANKAACDLIGIRPENLRTAQASNLMPREYLAAHTAGLKKWRNDLTLKYAEVVCKIRLPNGALVPIMAKIRRFSVPQEEFGCRYLFTVTLFRLRVTKPTR